MGSNIRNRLQRIESEMGFLSDPRTAIEMTDRQLETLLAKALGKPGNHRFSDSELEHIASLPTA